LQKERIITAVLISCLFGGLVGGPVASLINYYGSPEERFRLFIVPEIIGFISVGLLIYYGKSRRNRRTDRRS
jgi:hypothetical protein